MAKLSSDVNFLLPATEVSYDAERFMTLIKLKLGRRILDQIMRQNASQCVIVHFVHGILPKVSLMHRFVEKPLQQI